jgi:tripartite-type tricarboxylate transporter receptor subunit TctC
MMRRRDLVALTLFLGLPRAFAQGDGDYPNRPVRMIAAAAPGGNPDVLARLLSQKLSAAFGRAFVVENVPGAGGVVAAKMVAAAAPDGHVLMLGDSGAMAINFVLNADLGYDPLRDFTPITALVTVPTVLVLHPAVPAKTLPELVALAKSKPGHLAYGSAGPGSIHHLTMAIFAAQTGIELLHVPYRGGTALVSGLLKGEVQAGWSGIPNVLPLIEDGKLRVLCISTRQRSQSVPEVPTAIELGIERFDYATMMGLQTSAGAGRDLVARLQGTVARALREPDIVERMAILGMELRENGTADYARFMRDDIERYRTAMQTFKLQVN